MAADIVAEHKISAPFHVTEIDDLDVELAVKHEILQLQVALASSVVDQRIKQKKKKKMMMMMMKTKKKMMMMKKKKKKKIKKTEKEEEEE